MSGFVCLLCLALHISRRKHVAHSFFCPFGEARSLISSVASSLKLTIQYKFSKILPNQFGEVRHKLCVRAFQISHFLFLFYIKNIKYFNLNFLFVQIKGKNKNVQSLSFLYSMEKDYHKRYKCCK